MHCNFGYNSLSALVMCFTRSKEYFINFIIIFLIGITSYTVFNIHHLRQCQQLAVIVKNARNIIMTIEDIRNICISLPHATEDIKYGTDLCFSIEGKIFCGTRIERPFKTGIKCNESDFSGLIERQGIVPMPRLSTTYWIRIEKDDALSSLEWKQYIKKSYDLIITGLPKKIEQSIIK